MGEVLCVSDKDLSVAGGVGQGTLRPTDGQGGTPTFKNVLKCAMPSFKLTLHTLPSGFTEPLCSNLHHYGSFFSYKIMKLPKKKKTSTVFQKVHDVNDVVISY